MSEIVERVAMAIAGYMHPDNVEKYWFNWIQEVEREHYRIQARAAIAAMREPTKEMWKAAKVRDGDFLEDNWAAMIDAALK